MLLLGVTSPLITPTSGVLGGKGLCLIYGSLDLRDLSSVLSFTSRLFYPRYLHSLISSLRLTGATFQEQQWGDIQERHSGTVIRGDIQGRPSGATIGATGGRHEWEHFDRGDRATRGDNYWGDIQGNIQGYNWGTVFFGHQLNVPARYDFLCD
jgi:hypothetical protein